MSREVTIIEDGTEVNPAQNAYGFIFRSELNELLKIQKTFLGFPSHMDYITSKYSKGLQNTAPRAEIYTPPQCDCYQFRNGAPPPELSFLERIGMTLQWN